MVLLEFSISPTGKGESLSTEVAKIIDYIDKSGTAYQLTPMGTILEGSWDEVMGVVTGCFKLMQQSSSRIGVHLKVDYRAGSESRLQSKIEKVESIIGRSVNK